MDFGLGAMIWNFLKSTLESKIDTIDSNVDDINTNIDQSLSTTESNIRGTDDDTLKTLSDQLDTTESKIDTIDSNVDTINSNIDQSLSTTESNIRGADNDTLKTLSDQIDNIDITSAIEAEYTADGDISQGDLVGVTEDGKAATVTPDYTIPAPPSSWTSFVTPSNVIYYPRSCMVSDTKIAVVYVDYDGTNYDVKLIAGEIQSDGTINWGTAQDTGSDVGGSGDLTAICKCGTDKIAIAHTDGTNGIVRVCTLSGTTFTIGSSTAFSSGDDPKFVDICSPDTDVIVVDWRPDPSASAAHVYAKCATISGTTPTFGSTVSAIATSDKGGCAICPIDTNKVYVSAINGVTKDDLVGMLLTISGNTLYTTTQQTLDGSNFSNEYDYPRMCQYDTNKAVIVVEDNSSVVHVIPLSVSGTSTSYSVNTTTSIGDIYMNHTDCVGLDSSHIAIVTTYPDTKVIYASITGTSYTEEYVYDWSISSNYSTSVGADSNNNIVVVGYSSNLNYATAHFMELQLTTYDTDPPKFAGFLGVAKENITDGNTGTIGVRGVFSNVKTGMDPAKVYITGDNAYEFVNTAYKRYAKQNVLAVPLSSNVLLITDSIKNEKKIITPKVVNASVSSTSYNDVINITGKGYLIEVLQVTNSDDSYNVYAQIIIDGETIYDGYNHARMYAYNGTTKRVWGLLLLNHRFESSLRVRHRTGSATTLYTTVTYYTESEED